MTDEIHFTIQAKAYVKNEKVFIDGFYFPPESSKPGRRLAAAPHWVFRAWPGSLKSQRPDTLCPLASEWERQSVARGAALRVSGLPKKLDGFSK